MMKLVIDSGSTKADWRLVKQNAIKALETLGLSPVLHSKEFIEKTIEAACDQHPGLKQEVTQVYYYGTGCWDAPRKTIIAQSFEKVFVNAKVEVETDLLGAARATCGRESGIVAIMGTGSNSCQFDGTKIMDQVENLGYLLGDEGSGGDLGKVLLRAYFYKELPPLLSRQLDQYFPNGKTTLLDQLYNNERPNAYLASFTKFISAHKEYPEIKNLIVYSFATFFDRHLKKYQNHQQLPIHFVGSIAFYFQEFIQKLLEDRKMQVGLIIKKPIDNLVKFHINYE